MSELAKCRLCGGAPTTGHLSGEYWVECLAEDGSGCATSTSGDCPSVAAERWNDLMRPRPVAEWTGDLLMCGGAKLGRVDPYPRDGFPLDAFCCLTGETLGGHERGPLRAWLAEKVRAAGFDVKEEPHG